jgi:hypothetical protein
MLQGKNYATLETAAEFKWKEQGPQIFQRSKHYLKILGTERMTRSKFHFEDPQILGAILQNLVTWVVCPLEKNIIAFELYNYLHSYL